MLAKEQEILREHARAARAIANQSQPLSVCTILREEEIYNLPELEQVKLSTCPPHYFCQCLVINNLSDVFLCVRLKIWTH